MIYLWHSTDLLSQIIDSWLTDISKTVDSSPSFNQFTVPFVAVRNLIHTVPLPIPWCPSLVEGWEEGPVDKETATLPNQGETRDGTDTQGTQAAKNLLRLLTGKSFQPEAQWVFQSTSTNWRRAVCLEALNFNQTFHTFSTFEKELSLSLFYSRIQLQGTVPFYFRITPKRMYFLVKKKKFWILAIFAQPTRITIKMSLENIFLQCFTWI